MKKILIVERELQGKIPANKRIMFKKNKTIIKDNNILDYPERLSEMLGGIDLHPDEINWYLEEWEILNTEKVQLVCANNGIKLRPVHIISSLEPRNGAKALFQSKKLIILKIQDGVFELSKNTISDYGNIDVNVLSVGEYRSAHDIRAKLEKDYQPMVNSYIKNRSEFLDNYMSPLWGSCN